MAQQLAFNKMDKKKTNRRFDKNLTFSTPVDDPVMDEDFDFEKNLALFDKQAIWDKIDANQKPDLVSLQLTHTYTCTCKPNRSIDLISEFETNLYTNNKHRYVIYTQICLGSSDWSRE